MANFFYFDNNGTKQGPYDSVQLITLAKNGSIKPDTLIENESGKQTKAENITGLFPRPVPLPESNTNTSSMENPFINPPSAAATPCPHCGEPMTAGEKFCGSCGKSVFVPTQPCPHCGTTVAVGEKVCYRCGKSPSQPVSQYFSTSDNSFNGNSTPYLSGNTQSNPFAQSYNPQPSSGGGFLDIGFTRFITPIWISVIWVICIVLNVISLPVGFYYIAVMAKTAPNDTTSGLIILFGIPASIILTLFELLVCRIALEFIIVVFKIEKNTRAILSKQQ